MKKNLKLLSAALSLALVGGSIAGCGAADASAKKTKTEATSNAGDTTAAAEKKLKLGITLYSLKNEYTAVSYTHLDCAQDAAPAPGGEQLQPRV